MQAVGMIAEFNPLHNGHVYALQQARQQSGAEVVVVAMAGNFTQRGDVAIVDKWARAQAALACGADLVIELPVTDAVQAAPNFAQGGVALLAALGVATLAFGTEAPSLDYAKLAAQMAAAPPEAAHFHADFTQTYATQLNAYYQAQFGVDLSSPNMLLGLSYAQANAAIGTPLHLLPLQRIGAAHDAAQSVANFASASALRRKLAAQETVTAFVPQATMQALAARHLSWAELYPLLRYRLHTAELSELQQIDAMSEGLEYRLTQQNAAARDFTSFLHAVKSKRYTYARLRRLALATVLNLTQARVEFAHAHRYLQVLGFTPAGRQYLHAVKKQVALPLITRVSQAMIQPGGLLETQARADRLIADLVGQEQNYGRVPLQG